MFDSAIFKSIKLLFLDGRDVFKDHTPMVQVVVKCLITRDKSLEDLYTHLR